MPFPLIPVIVGVSAFLLGLGAGTIARSEDGTTFDLDDAVGSELEVVLKSGRKRTGLLHYVTEDYLVLEPGEGEFLQLQLEKIKQVYVHC